MSEIEGLSSRIMSAMDRVSNGLDALADVGTSEVEALKAALEEERKVNAELNERVSGLSERQELALSAMETKASEAEARIARLDTELQQLRQAFEMQSKAGEALREANAAGVGDAELINTSFKAELDALHAMRRAERAEADEIISGLMPLLKASGSAGATEEVG